MATKRFSRITLLTFLFFSLTFVMYLSEAYTQQGPKPQDPALAKQPQVIPLQILPKDNAGNVDWVKALRQGIIKPLDTLDPKKTSSPVIDLDINFKVKGDLPDVVYPHFPHTQWLACNNCHPKIFIMSAGANKITMKKIEEGQFCGRCHGVVAFPLSNCSRCHSKPKR